MEDNRDKFATFFDHSPDGIVITNEDGVIEDWNSSMEKFTGISGQLVIGKNLTRINPELEGLTEVNRQNFENLIEKFNHLITSKEIASYDYKRFFIFFDNVKSGHIELENTLFRFESNQERKFGLIARDITKQRLTEQNALLYKNIFDNNLDGIAILDLKGNYLEINSAHTKILGFEKDELLGKKPSIFLNEKLFGEIFKVYDFQGIFEGELSAKTKNNRSVFLDYILFPVMSEGVQICSVEITRDISQRKHTERELLDAKRKAEESDQLKTAFLSNMSHEIRTPMNSILGFSRLLEKPGLNHKLRLKYLHFINKNGESLLNLIGDIIDIAKIESNQLRINKESGNLTELMSRINSSMMKVMENEEKAGVRLISSYNKDKDLYIFTDIFRLEQILNNLIYNAIKFTHEGFIEFGYSIPKPDELLFFVKDSGIGIPSERMETIFKRFHKLEHSKKKLYGGAGLGLAISSQLVQLLGGRIWVDSNEGEGSTFYFTLPFVKSRVEKSPFILSDTLNHVDWRDKQVLIVEDDIFSYELLCEYLKESKLRILHAKDGKEAVSVVAEKNNLDLILMDIQLPGINGIEATRLIREMNKDIPIIAQTAFAMEEDKKQALEAGFSDFLTKPVNREIFLTIVKKFLNNGSEKV